MDSPTDKNVLDEILSHLKNLDGRISKIEDRLSNRSEAENDETYSCLVCIVKKPKYISEVLVSTSTLPHTQSKPPVNYIMEPTIMKQVMNTIERDKIKWGGRLGKVGAENA